MTMGQGNFAPNGQQQAGFGSNPMGQMDPMMLRLLMPDLFGEPMRESAYEDAVFAGSVRKGNELEIGTFSIMVLKPDATHPQAEMVVRTNGMVTTTVERLKKIGDAFLRWAKDEELAEALATAQQEEGEAFNESIMVSAAKGGGLGL